jgi:hypothetical protein
MLSDSDSTSVYSLSLVSNPQSVPKNWRLISLYVLCIQKLVLIKNTILINIFVFIFQRALQLFLLQETNVLHTECCCCVNDVSLLLLS